ncbi:MAG TPA: 5-(carboxyamino)imidazole ribonucleotide synthase, partial [Frankiaceae bacterium]|nr:5-(carboxyamino)imidazole ribonucleotide synthase [Frankiaceae bacterium]
DGRGVWLVEDETAAGRLLTEVDVPLFAEERVPLERELAAVVARTPGGETRAWPVVETVQRDGICVEVLAPAPGIDPRQAATAQEIALVVAAELGVVGVLAVELFARTDGALVVNELAIRPHNSAHWTIEGARTSQFEQHLRAVLDWPLGETTPTAPATAMANVLGGPDPDLARRLPAVLAADPGARVHLYGKAPRPGRKLGHVTVVGDDPVEVRRRAVRAAALLRGDAP